jgi:hypothetical protein
MLAGSLKLMDWIKSLTRCSTQDVAMQQGCSTTYEDSQGYCDVEHACYVAFPLKGTSSYRQISVEDKSNFHPVACSVIGQMVNHYAR